MSDDIAALAASLSSAPGRVEREVKQVVSKGSMNIKNQLIREARTSDSFYHLALSIGYDITETDAYIEGEIGPQKERHASAGLLGAYWGWSKGGGSSLPDPLGALEAEQPRMSEALTRLAEVILE